MKKPHRPSRQTFWGGTDAVPLRVRSVDPGVRPGWNYGVFLAYTHTSSRVRVQLGLPRPKAPAG